MPKAKLNPPETFTEMVDVSDVPTRTQKPFRGRIGSWRRVFISPGKYCITGKVFGYPDRLNGSIITTSMVVKKDRQEIETMNSRYRLIGK